MWWSDTSGTMLSSAPRVFRRLEGLFCVYKPPGVHWKVVRDSVETNLLQGLSSAAVRPCPREIRLLPCPGGDSEASLRVASVPVLSQHPLVTGPQVKHIKIGVGHRLDTLSSGVLVLAVGSGNKVLTDFYKTPTTKEYTLEGEFGTATDDFSHKGRVVEKTTYNHITQDKLNRVLAMLQGANQKALLMYSNVDLRSQEAYELAARGLLGPAGKSEPILTGLRCIRFQPPNFTLEVQCLNETQKFLRKVVHEIGLELRSTAVCKGVRRTRDGPFTVQNALIRHQWTTSDVMQAIQEYRSSKKNKKYSKS